MDGQKPEGRALLERALRLLPYFNELRELDVNSVTRGRVFRFLALREGRAHRVVLALIDVRRAGVADCLLVEVVAVRGTTGCRGREGDKAPGRHERVDDVAILVTEGQLALVARHVVEALDRVEEE